MGVDKAEMLVDGVPSAVRIHRLLALVVGPVLEVGPGVSGAVSVREPVPGSGPLAAVAAGGAELRRRGHDGPALVVACDLPLLDRAVLEMLAGWPEGGSVVPVVEEQPQPLCARWAPAELRAAEVMVARGARSMRALWERSGVVLADPSGWPSGVDPAALTDADTPEDLVRLGFERPDPG